jgi:hypothetical protein
MHGQKLFTFEGHEAPVYSICPHHKENIQVCFLNTIRYLQYLGMSF